MIKVLTLAEARAAGFDIVKGDYVDTADNNADRWYIDDKNSSTVDRRGSGFRTRQEALEALNERIGTLGKS